MALALLKCNGIIGDAVELESDIGTSRFYKIKVGRSKINTNGLEFLDDITYETPLLSGPEFNIFNSGFTVKVPADKFNGQSKFAQLTSFKDDRKKSPAISKVVMVYPDLNLLNGDLSTMSTVFYNQANVIPPEKKCRAVGFSFREAPELSHIMFWEALIQAARSLAPAAVNTIAGQVNGSKGQSVKNEDIINFINAILEALIQRQGQVNPPLTGNSPTYKNFSTQKDGGVISGPAIVGLLTKIAPLLIQILPQLLGPLLDKAPQLLQITADSPVKLLNAVNEGINQREQNELQSKQADQKHVENLLRDSEQNLVKQSSMAFGKIETRSKSSLIIQKDNPVTVNGKPKFVYSDGGGIKLLIHLNIANGIQKGKTTRAIVDLYIKDAVTGKTMLEKSFRLKEVTSNSMHELEIPHDEIQGLPRNKDLLISITSRYVGTGNKILNGGADVHFIFIASDYFYKGLGGMTGETIPLADRNRHRVFWNKIFEGGTQTEKRWEINLMTKYYNYYSYDQPANGRIETRIQQIEPDSENEMNIEGKMKSGLEISPAELNNLLPAISSYSPLEPAKFNAFKTDELSKDYNSEVLASLKMKGRNDETGMIFTYPEIGLFEFLLNKTTKVNQYGQVIEVQEEKAIFPKPVSIHFVGEKITPQAGQEQLFDYKAELRPVELAPLR